MAADPTESLPVDEAGAKIYALKYLSNTQKSVTSSSVTHTLNTGCLAFKVVCDQDCFLEFNADATTGDFLLLANSYLDFQVFEETTLRAIRSTADGTLYIMEFGLE